MVETEQIRKSALAFWGEQTIVFVRWNGGIDIKQSGQTVFISDYEVNDFIKAIKRAVELSHEG